MKIAAFFFSLIMFWSCIAKTDEKIALNSSDKKVADNSGGFKNANEIKDIDYSSYFKEALQYTKKNNYNQDIFMLVDLGKHSGLKRFFVYDFKKDQIVKSYMVSHGCGDAAWGGTMTKDEPQISNVPDSHCSSIGKYMISTRGASQWGIKVNYLMLGKDKTNSNALTRAIVLHSWNAVPENEVYPEGTPEGWGCPAVSNVSMKEIDEMLKTNKRVLIWIIKT